MAALFRTTESSPDRRVEAMKKQKSGVAGVQELQNSRAFRFDYKIPKGIA
jgi:hypothetical protein